MKIPYYRVDAFTNRLFKGNPAGVCFLKKWLPTKLMQQIAFENNLAETAFIVKRNNLFLLRWFSPSIEVDLCGHATLASAHVLYANLGYKKKEVRFKTKSGFLTVRKKKDLLELDFPSRPPLPSQTPKELIQGLGIKPEKVLASRDYFAVFKTENQVRALKPNFSILSKLNRFAVIVTAPGKKSDFVSRFFAPKAGIPEDPVTGSAHCTLVPYWTNRLEKNKLHALQISQRGGELFCEDAGERVKIAGKAVTYSKGTIEV